MSNEIRLTVIGSLTADPELRYTPSGVPVTHLTVVSNPQVFHKPTGEWRDGDPIFLRCAVWRDPAENTASSLSKGDRVIVYGRLLQRNYDHNGEKRTAIELLVEELGPSLRWASAKVEKIRQVNSHGSTSDAGNDDEPPF